MKLTIINTKNENKGTIDLDVHEPVRKDLIKRAVLAYQSQTRQPYGADPRAGLKHATNVSKRRRKYRGSYGHGIARSPRKVLSRNGRQLFWVGAEAPNTRGGRRAHPPKSTKKWTKKINVKERRKAINSALHAAFNKALVIARGHKVPEHYPIVLDKDWEELQKTKDVTKALHTIGLEQELARGNNGGKTVLIITESDSLTKAAKNIPGVDVATPEQLNAHLLAPGAHPGRATLLTWNTAQTMSGQQPKKPATKKEAKKPAKKPKKTAKKTTTQATKKTAKKTSKKGESQ